MIRKPVQALMVSSALIISFTTSSSYAAPLRMYPAMSLSSPTGFGLSSGAASFGAGAVDTDSTSAAMAGSVGFGNPKSVAAQVSMVIASTNPTDGGFADDGFFNLKIHRANESGLASVSLGQEGILQWGAAKNDDPNTYIAATKVFPLANNTKALSLSAGVGDGRFVPASSSSNVGAFASIAYLPNPRLSLIADYAAKNLKAGVSFIPSTQIPVAVSIYADDINNEVGRTRAALSVAYGFSF